jgi:hypothetical protein
LNREFPENTFLVRNSKVKDIWLGNGFVPDSQTTTSQIANVALVMKKLNPHLKIGPKASKYISTG